MTIMRKIGIVTGSRAEYGYLRPLLKQISEDPRFELLLYVTGMHIVKKYGYSIQEIRKDGFHITDIVDMKIKNDNSRFDLSRSIGKGIIGFTNVFEKTPPDLLIVFGDRIEPYSAATAATTVNIPIAHINGGDVGMGDVDNNLRHAITKLSHIHFAASYQSYKRILKMGEEKWRCFNVGSLSLDTILHTPLLSKKVLLGRLKISKKPIILLSYHPVTTECDDAEIQILSIINAILSTAEKYDLNIVVIYPNAYPGATQIIRAITMIKKTNKNVYIFKNLPHIEYLSLLSYSSVFVGNSSSGIIEAPSLGIPFVCVGTRQKLRERGKNVIDADYDEDQIAKGLEKALFDKENLNVVKRCENPYGDGKAASRIIDVLANLDLNKQLLQKRITY
jgi:GDP/UDP-N,N'-diacetylbacillosamine 2-epimerase (hydrolysing)